MEFVIDGNDYEQIRLTTNEFRDVEYLHIRKYYLDFDSEWQPTKEGVSMPLTIDNSRNLMIAIMGLLSDAESKSIIEDHFLDIIEKLYK